jgi:alpha/beta superfamily hydrolase
MSDSDGDGKSILVPRGRDVRATLDAPGGAACVVACPPHPEMGGSRSDARLRAVSDALAPAACLRFDYGPWDEGRGELTDAGNALAWARDRYDRVGLLGFSFGGAVALLAAAEAAPDSVSTLAPAARLPAGLDAVDALDAIDCPTQVVYGERDTTADWEPVVERARELGHRVDALPADHFFVGQERKVADRIAAFYRDHL